MTKNTIYYLLFTLFPFLCFVMEYSASEEKSNVVKTTTVLKVRQVCDTDRDRAALEDLYRIAGGENWLRKENWLSNLSLGQWEGISVNAEGCVTEIFLGENNLEGTLPSSIGDFSELSILSLESVFGGTTKLTGSLPIQIGNLSNLTQLYLSNNNFQGGFPDEFYNLTNLNIFSITSNSSFGGTISEDIGNLTNLRILYLSGNGFTGELPTRLGELNNLTLLSLSSNAFTGSIPQQLSNLTNLEHLYLHENMLSGSVPEDLANLVQLQSLYLYNNDLEGCFSDRLRIFCGLGQQDNSELSGYDFRENPKLDDFLVFCNNQVISCEDQPDCSTLQVTLAPTNVSCFGENNGSITATPSGGMITYSFLWSNNQTSSTITNLSPGTYTVTVTDGNGCTTTQSTTITQPAALSGIITTIATIKCANGNDGSLGTSFSGGTTPYTYAWNTGSVESTITNLSEGTYELTISDANNCEFRMTTTLSAPSDITGSLIPQMVSCIGASDGLITGMFSGGTAPYTYAWNNGATQSSISGLSPDTYTVTVTDFSNCSITQSAVITAPVALSAAIAAVQDVSCDGQNGSIELAINGGTMPYSYSLDGTNFQAGTSIPNLSAGDYTITVRDNNNCETQVMATVSPCTNNTQITCTVFQSVTTANTNDGQIQLVITDIGISKQLSISSSVLPNGEPIISDLNEGDTTIVLTNLVAGEYDFFVFSTDPIVTCNLILEIQSCRERDSLALVALYNSTNGANWTRNDNWLSDQPIDTWFGVTVGNEGCVTRLELCQNCYTTFADRVGNNLNGILPSELGALIDLNILAIFKNDNLTGSIPPEIGQLSKLSNLSLFNNQLNGSIPFEMGQLTNLKNCYLYSNQLSGIIPSELVGLTTVEELYLFNNELTGTIPAELGQLPNLIDIKLQNNNLSGCYEEALRSICDITFDFSNNPQLPWEGIFTNFCNGGEQEGAICNDGNELTFDDKIQTDCSCLGVDFETKIDCSIIKSPSDMNASDGQIQLVVTDIGENKQFSISSAAIPNTPIIFDLSPGDTSIIVSDLAVGEYDFFVFSTNPIVTCNLILEIQTCRAQDSLALVDLYNSTNGGNWTNRWDLSSPMDTWFGVTLNEEGCVNELNLFNNNLNGSIAVEIGNLSELELLSLSTNELIGEIPLELEKLTRLRTLDLGINNLSGSIPSELSKLTNLRALSLASNQLIGDIPSSIGDLVLLQELYLDQNEFTGIIPSSFEKLNELQILHMYDCGLIGEIPIGFGDFSNIKRIFLHENDLSGCFPGNFLKLCQIGASPFPDEPGYNFSNNPKLPWQGDLAQFCNNQEQIGATCNDGNPNTQEDVIKENCECLGKTCNSITTNIQNTICFGESFSFNGQLLTESAVYIDTIPTTLGCDSIINLELKVVESITENETVTRCEGETYDFKGAILAESGTYRDTIKNNQGCDSLVSVLELIILNDVPISNTIFTCNRAEVGLDTVMETSVEGCDSVVVTETLLNPSDSTFLMEFTCDENQEGTRINVLTNQFGCDSTIFIAILLDDTKRQTNFEIITCNPTEVGIDTLVIATLSGCDSLIITATTFDGIVRQSEVERTTCNPAEAGLDTLMVTTLLGCDSMIITNTILLASDTTTLFEETCEASEVETIMQSYTNIAGCDSIVVLEIRLENQEPILLEADNIIINTVEEAVPINILENDVLPMNADDWIFTVTEPPYSGEVINRGGNQFFLDDPEATTNSTIDSFTYEICLTNCPNICDNAKVTLVIDNNCIDQLKKNIPSAFSPLSFEVDNKIFDPRAAFSGCIDSNDDNFELIIFNRWGETVFHPIIYEAWDGSSANNSTDIMPRATYYYHLKIRQPAPLKNKILRGPINLLY